MKHRTEWIWYITCSHSKQPLKVMAFTKNRAVQHVLKRYPKTLIESIRRENA